MPVQLMPEAVSKKSRRGANRRSKAAPECKRFVGDNNDLNRTMPESIENAPIHGEHLTGTNVLGSGKSTKEANRSRCAVPETIKFASRCEQPLKDAGLPKTPKCGANMLIPNRARLFRKIAVFMKGKLGTVVNMLDQA